MRVVNNNTRRSTRLQPILDNRLFQPLPLNSRPIKTVHGLETNIVNKPSIRKRGSSAFAYIPRSAIICARRKIRKEVIFAKNKQGSGNSRPRYNENSKLYCK